MIYSGLSTISMAAVDSHLPQNKQLNKHSTTNSPVRCATMLHDHCATICHMTTDHGVGTQQVVDHKVRK